METFLIVLTLIVSILLIAVVMSQETKTPGMSSSIGGGAEGTVGGKSRGKDEFLSRLTVIFGIIFAVLCLLLGRYLNTF